MNFLSVFDHFVGVALKGLNSVNYIKNISKKKVIYD